MTRHINMSIFQSEFRWLLVFLLLLPLRFPLINLAFPQCLLPGPCDVWLFIALKKNEVLKQCKVRSCYL
ncbi:hypothetical protein V6Z11_D04G030600 [Gossypium hirsutum]